jgi:hypothetical protein
MDTNALRSFVNEHPAGVRLRLADGTEYRLLHRDYIWFTPAFGKRDRRAGRYATCFWIHDPETQETKLVNALLVTEATPLARDAGNGGPHSASDTP